MFSFHETKNFISGQGGALLVNDNKYVNMFRQTIIILIAYGPILLKIQKISKLGNEQS